MADEVLTESIVPIKSLISFHNSVVNNTRKMCSLVSSCLDNTRNSLLYTNDALSHEDMERCKPLIRQITM